MLYSVLADAYRKIEATTKRLEITSLLVELLRNTPAEDIERVVYLTQGKLGPDYLGVELGIAEKQGKGRSVRYVYAQARNRQVIVR